MAAPQHSNTLQRDFEIGGGEKGRRVKVVTQSRVVAEFAAGEPVLIMPTVSADPAADPADYKAGLFFRDRGDGKLQACIRFPTGNIQILATEN